MKPLPGNKKKLKIFSNLYWAGIKSRNTLSYPDAILFSSVLFIALNNAEFICGR